LAAAWPARAGRFLAFRPPPPAATDHAFGQTSEFAAARGWHANDRAATSLFRRVSDFDAVQRRCAGCRRQMSGDLSSFLALGNSSGGQHASHAPNNSGKVFVRAFRFFAMVPRPMVRDHRPVESARGWVEIRCRCASLLSSIHGLDFFSSIAVIIAWIYLTGVPTSGC